MMSGKRIDEVATMEMRTSALSRRQLLKAGGAAAVVAGAAPSIVIPGRARAQQKTLKILQWKHFVPSYDEWFNGTYVKEWGEQNDTEVLVDNVGVADIEKLAKVEMGASQGHDLVLFVKPPSEWEGHVIDHHEIYEECESKYGKPFDFCVKSTYNPKTDTHIGFCGVFLPAVISYRKDLWGSAGATPESWADVLEAGRRIKLLYDKPVGISLAPEQNSGQTIRAIMYSFGASEQNADGNPILKSKETLEVIKYVKALYEEAMFQEVLTWDAASNNRFMLAGDGSLTLDTISIPRASESMGLPISKDLWLGKPPEGPNARLAPSFGFMTYVIWHFAANIDGAIKFLVDYIASSRQGLFASGFQNMAAFPDTVPHLREVVANDAAASPPDKYSLLADVAGWTTNIGYPGYTSPAISEIYNKGITSRMCAQAATGELTPEEALDQADKEVRQIFQKWKERGKV
jgi:multiple sugar transport system substrate-binding protein